MAGSVIQATGMVEFKNGLRTEYSLEAAGALEATGALVATAPNLRSIPNTPVAGGEDWSWRRCSCHKVHFPEQTPILPNSVHWWCYVNHSHNVVLG